MTPTLAFEVGQTVRATHGLTTIVGTIDAYTHHGQPLMTIHPHGVTGRFSTFDIWAGDGWAIDIIEEQP